MVSIFWNVSSEKSTIFSCLTPLKAVYSPKLPQLNSNILVRINLNPRSHVLFLSSVPVRDPAAQPAPYTPVFCPSQPFYLLHLALPVTHLHIYIQCDASCVRNTRKLCPLECHGSSMTVLTTCLFKSQYTLNLINSLLISVEKYQLLKRGTWDVHAPCHTFFQITIPLPFLGIFSYNLKWLFMRLYSYRLYIYYHLFMCFE